MNYIIKLFHVYSRNTADVPALGMLGEHEDGIITSNNVHTLRYRYRLYWRYLYKMYSWSANDYVIIDRCFEKAFLETLAPCLRRATCANDATRAFAICRNSPRASHCAHMKLAGSATSGNDVTSSSRRGRREGDEEEVEDGRKKKKKKLHHLHLYTTSKLLPSPCSPPNLPLPSSPTTSPYLPDLTSPSAYPPLLSPTIVTVLTPLTLHTAAPLPAIVSPISSQSPSSCSSYKQRVRVTICRRQRQTP